MCFFPTSCATSFFGVKRVYVRPADIWVAMLSDVYNKLIMRVIVTVLINRHDSKLCVTLFIITIYLSRYDNKL